MEGNLIIMGGGAVCFSFGTFWNKGVFSLHLQNEPQPCADPSRHGGIAEPTIAKWIALQTSEVPVPQSSMATLGRVEVDSRVKANGEVKSVKQMSINSAAEFHAVVQAAQPVILKNLDIGRCTTTWTPEYLTERIGGDRTVRLGAFTLSIADTYI
jgi:tRNA wybutosine-synthesizing protein 4